MKVELSEKEIECIDEMFKLVNELTKAEDFEKILTQEHKDAFLKVSESIMAKLKVPD